MHSPLSGNPLRNREDVQRAVLALVEPLLPHYEASGPRVRLGSTGAHFSRAAEELEGWARPLWGLAPLAAGGGEFGHWGVLRRGLAAGTDPADRGYWGALEDTDQRMVEMAAVGFALALVPEHLWEPLEAPVRERVLAWLAPINRHSPHANNWQFFRILVNLGLARVGGTVDRGALEQSFAELESHWLGDGWYRDGLLPGNVDHYIGWAYHFYGLLYAALAGHADAERTARFRVRARRFALDFQHWFDATGAVIPYGRSLTYRFAAGSFWGALAYAGEEALPWGIVKGLYLRHLRWWAQRPQIFRPDGVLSIGYGYENLFVSESYNSPGSPYWAMKTFLPLALPAEHPFWRAEETPLPPAAEPSIQVPAAMVVARDEAHAFLLNGGRGFWFVRQGAAKYGKFAYSSRFAFALAPDDPFSAGMTDSMLILTGDDERPRARARVVESGVDGDVVWSRWTPSAGVTVTTVLWAAGSWHLRLHRLETTSPLTAVETGFAVGWEGGDPAEPPVCRVEEEGCASVAAAGGFSAIVDLMDEPPAALPAAAPRAGRVQHLQANMHVLEPRALVPSLARNLEAGVHLLACAVLAAGTAAALAPPQAPARLWDTLLRRSAPV